VIRHDGTFEVLTTNTLDHGVDASAALVDGHIFLRGDPGAMGEPEVTACLSRPAARGVTASTQNQALSAILFSTRWYSAGASSGWTVSSDAHRELKPAQPRG
jgi:hypothetical protein